MKKILLVTFLLVGMLGFTQKKLIITNLTSYPVKIYSIRTKPNTGTVPYCQGYNFGLNPRESCTLENSGSSTKFPFLTTAVQPANLVSSNWLRYALPGVYTNFTAANLWNAPTGITQSFNYISYSVGNLSGSQGQRNPTFGVSSVTPYTNVAGAWELDYFRDSITTTNYVDYVTFFDI